jgi:flagellar hook-basal body complex protein FliE
MIALPPVGGVAGGLSAAQLGETGAAQAQKTTSTGLSALGAGETSPVSAGETSGVEGTGATSLGTSEGGSFGGALTEAISSLEKTQTSADSASQALATGTVKDPESAVVTVEEAQLAMQLASQIRTKATEAAQSIFATQV